MRRLSLAVLAGLVTAGICAGVGMGPAVAAPPTPVTCGSVITAPGQYRLAGLCGGPGITILADDVTLYLGGYLMIGPDFTGTGLTVAGSRAHVEGPGKVTGFSVGVAITGNGAHVNQVTAMGDLVGISASRSNGNQINNNYVQGNAEAGIQLMSSNGNTIAGNNVPENGLFGISVGRGSTGNGIHDNVVLRTGNYDLADDNPACDNNQWSGNQFVTANQPCIH